MACILLATIGGFGSIFNLLVKPDVRCYNRISIFIVFLSLAALGIALTKLFSLLPRQTWATAASYAFLAFLVFVGIVEQNEASSLNALKTQDQKKFQIQSAFVQQIEKSLPKDAMVYQLPEGSYGDDPRLKPVMWNAQAEPFLVSNSVRWSWPAVSPEAAIFGSIVEELNASALVDAVYYRGYRGIFIDKVGYEDSGERLISALAGYLGRQPIRSADERYAFFSLSGPVKKDGMESERYVWGSPILFTPAGTAARYLAEGWSCLGCTEGKNSTMQLRVSPSSDDVTLKAHITPALFGSIHDRPVRIFVNDVLAGDWDVRQSDWYSIPVPHRVLGNKALLSLRFEFPNAASPESLALNQDPRILGVHFEEMLLAPKSE